VKQKGEPIAGYKERILGTYAILLIGSWMIDLLLDPRTPFEIRSVVSGLKWMMTIPLIIAGIGIVIWIFGALAFGLLEANSRNVSKDQVFLQKPAESKSQEAVRVERLREKEHREAVAAEMARARFHEMKQTRSATEAAKASLEEF